MAVERASVSDSAAASSSLDMAEAVSFFSCMIIFLSPGCPEMDPPTVSDDVNNVLEMLHVCLRGSEAAWEQL